MSQQLSPNLQTIPHPPRLSRPPLSDDIYVRCVLLILTFPSQTAHDFPFHSRDSFQ